MFSIVYQYTRSNDHMSNAHLNINTKIYFFFSVKKIVNAYDDVDKKPKILSLNTVCVVNENRDKF